MATLPLHPSHQLSPSFEQFLQSLPAEKCQQALLWFSMNDSIDALQSDALKITLDRIEQLNNERGLELIAELSVTEQISYTVMNEFGANIRNQSYFNRLVSTIQQHLAKNNTEYVLTEYSNN